MLDIIVVTRHREGWEDAVQTWRDTTTSDRVVFHDYHGQDGMLPAMQRAYLETKGDYLGYFHDDLLVHESGWDRRVLQQFESADVGVVGFGGSLGHGDPDIYKKPYHLSQLGRSFYLSNTDDAEIHGQRFEGEREVATLDGFAMVIRKTLLDKVGGWPLDKFTFHCYDHWLTLIARRHSYRVRLIGVRCHHLGGLTSTTPEYQEWHLSKHGKTDAEGHTAAHQYIYEEFRDVLPVFIET